MLIKSINPFHPRESEVTDPVLYARRREFIQQTLALGALGWSGLYGSSANAKISVDGFTTASSYSTDEELTPYEAVTSYNNFYELGTDKRAPKENAHLLKTDPWSIQVEGECNKPGTYAIEDVLKTNTFEQRIYRLRCVEAWSMVIPWIGTGLADVLKKFEPNGNAKFVEFQTILDPDNLPGQRRNVLQWPYQEGLRIDEAMHPLAFLAVGLYDRVMPNQNGAPVRLVVPWKYGFKSIKSIVKIRFAEKQPETSWNRASAREYGFYSNVNPQVDHPRWSQARERRIGEFRKRETLMFNGYADEVASLYTGMDLQKNF